LQRLCVYFLVVSIKFSAETYITRYKSRGLSALKLSFEKALPLSIIITFKEGKIVHPDYP
jgi:hypothetical protein